MTGLETTEYNLFLNRHTKQKKCPDSITLLDYCTLPSLAALHTFSMCNTAKLRITSMDKAKSVATCILEPQNESRHPILLFQANQVKVVTYVCATMPTHVMCGQETLQTYGFRI